MTDLPQTNQTSRSREIRQGSLIVTVRDTDMLTPPELEVVCYLLQGFSLSQIACLRHRSIKTVSIQKQQACRKLGCASTATLLLALLDNGIVTLRRAGDGNRA
ncbi:TPA: helix-turn-helix transcriptional regulator [Salmonella enterica]|nr:helix-turn-helix transcriptional regulator [Salmonella enterica]